MFPELNVVRKRALSDGILLSALSVLLQFIPGFNTLDYHFSAAVSIPLAAAVGGITIVCLFDTGTRRTNLLRGLKYSMVLTVIPLMISLIGSLFNGLCNPLYSLGFYLMGPVASTIFAWGVSVGFAGLTNSKKAAFIGFYVLLLTSFAENALYFFFQPAVAFYNAFLGFFPGPIYETAVRIGSAYIWFRVVTSILALLSVVTGLWLSRYRPAWRILGAIALAGMIYMFLSLGAVLGYRPGIREVRRTLSQKLHYNNITLRYSPNTQIGYAKAVLQDATARWQDLEHYFRVMDHRAITIYLYPDKRTSKRLTGTASVDVAKVWLNQVHITPYQPGDVILEHELAHCFAARFSDTILKIPFDGLVPRMDLTEGMAVAAAFDSTPLSPHEWAAAMNRSGHITNPLDFKGFAGFALAAPAKAYIIAGSFMRFIHDRYGASAIETVYRQGNYHSLPQDVHVVVKQWLRFLAHYSVPGRFLNRAAQMATAKGVMHTRCLTERSRLKEDMAYAFKKGRLGITLGLARQLDRMVPTVRLRAFIVLLQVLQGNIGAGASFLAAWQPTADPNVAGMVMSIASTMIQSSAELPGLLPVNIEMNGPAWSEVILKQCMAVESGPYFGDFIKELHQPVPPDDLIFGPCTAYAQARGLMTRGMFRQSCHLYQPSQLPTHFLRFDAYMMKAWCLFANKEYRPKLLQAMHREAIYEGERMATQKITDYTRKLKRDRRE